MNILIVEDCITMQNFLKTVIENNYEHWFIDVAESYDTAIDLVANNIYDFFILNYELDKTAPYKNGLSLGLYILSMEKYKHTPVVFETSHIEHAVNVVNQLNCLYYLVKPYDESQVHTMIKKVLKYIPSKITLSLKDEYGVLAYINLEDIIYIKADRHKLTIITKYKSLICTNHSLASLFDLCNGLLIRCHKSYLVNIQYIKFIDKSNSCLTVELPPAQNSYVIKIGRKYMKSILNYTYPISYLY